MKIESVTPEERDVWLEMRGQLWPDSRATHAHDVERFFSGYAREPLAVLLAKDENERALGFAEISIRSFEHSDLEPGKHEVFLGIRPEAQGRS